MSIDMTNNIHSMNSAPQALKQQGGFNLVELMVAIFLGIFLVLGVTNILLSDQMSFNAANRIARIQENGHLAKNMVFNDLKRARYMGANIELKALGGTEGSEVAAKTCVDDDTSWGRMVEQGLLGIDGVNEDVEKF